MSTESSPAALPRPVLIVDDDEDAHLFLKRDLAKCGITHPVASVFGGEDAIAYLGRCVAGEIPYPVLVFLDVKMPGSDGFEVLSWAQRHHVLGQVTLSMLTSSDDPKDVTKAMGLGAHTYLTKPPDKTALLNLVQSAIRLAERQRPSQPTRTSSAP